MVTGGGRLCLHWDPIHLGLPGKGPAQLESTLLLNTFIIYMIKDISQESWYLSGGV